MTAVSLTVKGVRALTRAYNRKWAFLGVFLLVFLVTFTTLAAFDVVPEPREQVAAVAETASTARPVSVAAATPEAPVHISIPAVGIDVAIRNPETTDIATLDAALLTGAVRYPTSAQLGEEGNMVLFGHSSYLPIVNNQAFKAFNEIQNLKPGDRITVTGTEVAQVYAVKTVSAADASADAIPLTKTGHTLTLATCDSFGKKTDRFIVTAELVETYALGS